MSDVKTKRSALIFGAMRQNVAAEHMAMAELEVADNVEMDDDGTWIKRPGFDRLTPSVDTGTWTAGGGGAAVDTDSARTAAVIDGADRCWSFDTGVSRYRDRGAYPRGYSRSLTRAPVARAIRTISVAVSTDTWLITQTELGYVYEVINTTSGSRVAGPVSVAASGIEAIAGVANATHVWLFYTTDNTTITAHRITIATPTVAPTITTYLTTAAATWQSVDAFTLSASTEIVVLASGINAVNAKYVHSYLDTATGAAKAAPAAVIVSNATNADLVAGATADEIQLSISCLNSTGSGTFFYTLWDQNVLKLVEVTAATLVTAATTTLLTETVAAATSMRGLASGYVEVASGNWVVFASSGKNLTGVVTNPALARFTKNGGSFTNESMQRNLWVASRPANILTNWFVAVQYESYLSDDDAALLQRTLFIMSADGHLLARVAPGQIRTNTVSDEVWPTTPDARSLSDIWITSCLADINGTSVSGAFNDLAHNPVFVKVDLGTAQNFGRPVKYADGKVCIPAGIPGMFGMSDRARSLTPLMFPTNITAALGSGTNLAGATGVAVVYRFVDADGTISRSSPTIASFTFKDAGTPSITVDTLRVGHASLAANAVNGDPLSCVIENRVEIELYRTAVGEADLRLLQVVANDPSAQTVTILIAPASLAFVSTELLYTTGGRLSNAVAPQTHAAAFWRERLHLASDDFVFSSDEYAFGFGPAFSEFKRRRYLGSTITALMPVDWNYLAAFKDNGIAVLSGQGPDLRGSGNYDIFELTTQKGVDRPRGVVQSIHGCHFQDSQDGQQCLITGQLQIVIVGDGVFDSRTSEVKDALHVEELRQVWFLLSDRLLVLDYEHTVKDQPYGRWAEWKSAGYSQNPPLMAFGSRFAPRLVLSDTGGSLRQRKTAVYTDDTTTTPVGYDQLLRTGEYPFAGLGGEYGIQEMLTLIENVSGSTRSIILTLSSDRAEKTSTDTFALETTRRRIHWKPGGQARVGGTKIQISDSSSETAGYRLIAAILEISAEFHGKFPRLGDRT